MTAVPTTKPFRILAIDGGGIRGVVPAHILHCLSTRLKVNPASHFDMIAGTSTGSIIAAALACGVAAEKIVELYTKNGAKIFKKKCSYLPEFFRPALHSVYDKSALSELLKETFGEKKLGEISLPLLLPATDIGNGGVHVFKSAYSKDFTRDNDVLVRDAVLASCSAPTYFDPSKVGAYALADGGLWANNPSLAATIDAQRRLGKDLKDVRVLSVGTGHSKTFYGADINRKWGLLSGWRGREFINFLMSLQAQSTHNYLQLILEKHQWLRLNFESDGPLPLDDCSRIDDLISRADLIFTHESASIKTFLGIN